MTLRFAAILAVFPVCVLCRSYFLHQVFRIMAAESAWYVLKDHFPLRVVERAGRREAQEIGVFGDGQRPACWVEQQRFAG